MHRNVRLETLFLEEGSMLESSTLKISDFTGFLCIPKGRASSRASPVGMLMYAAPEVLEETHCITTDCFSTGVVLFMLLVSAPPFASDSKFSYLRGVRSKDWHIAIDVSGASTVVRSLLIDLLNPNPLERYTARDALMHRWIVNECYARAADKVNGSCCSEDGGYALRFLKECGTGVGASSSMSLSREDLKFDVIAESEDE